MDYVIESEFTYCVLNCRVLFLEMGHRCGYVEVTNTPLHGKDYSDNLNVNINPKSLECGKRSLITLICWDGDRKSLDILCDVHGGVTFSRPFEPGSWWIGFDCAHYGDAKDITKLAEHFPDREIPQYLIDSNLGGIIRSKEYVEEECKSLALQLREIISLM